MANVPSRRPTTLSGVVRIAELLIRREQDKFQAAAVGRCVTQNEERQMVMESLIPYFGARGVFRCALGRMRLDSLRLLVWCNASAVVPE